MMENLSSKFDTLSGRVPGTTVLETNETNPENNASASKPTELNELTEVGGHYMNFRFEGLKLRLLNYKVV